MNLTLVTKKISITPTKGVVASVEVTTSVNGCEKRHLRNVLKEFYRRGLNNGIPRLCLDISGRKILFHVRANTKVPPTEEQICTLLDYLEIGRITTPVREPAKKMPPKFQRPPRPQYA